MPTSEPYRGYLIQWTTYRGGYRIFKDNELVTCLVFSHIETAKKVIDTYLKNN